MSVSIGVSGVQNTKEGGPGPRLELLSADSGATLNWKTRKAVVYLGEQILGYSMYRSALVVQISPNEGWRPWEANLEGPYMGWSRIGKKDRSGWGKRKDGERFWKPKTRDYGHEGYKK